MRPLPESHGLTLPDGAHPTRPWWKHYGGSTFWKQGPSAERRDGLAERGRVTLTSGCWPEEKPQEWEGFTEDALAWHDETAPLPAPALCDGQVWLFVVDGAPGAPQVGVLRQISWRWPSDMSCTDMWSLIGQRLTDTYAEWLLLGKLPENKRYAEVVRFECGRRLGAEHFHAWLVSDPRHPGKNVFWSAPAR